MTRRRRGFKGRNRRGAGRRPPRRRANRTRARRPPSRPTGARSAILPGSPAARRQAIPCFAHASASASVPAPRGCESGYVTIPSKCRPRFRRYPVASLSESMLQRATSRLPPTQGGTPEISRASADAASGLCPPSTHAPAFFRSGSGHHRPGHREAGSAFVCRRGEGGGPDPLAGREEPRGGQRDGGVVALEPADPPYPQPIEIEAGKLHRDRPVPTLPPVEGAAEFPGAAPEPPGAPQDDGAGGRPQSSGNERDAPSKDPRLFRGDRCERFPEPLPVVVSDGRDDRHRRAACARRVPSSAEPRLHDRDPDALAPEPVGGGPGHLLEPGQRIPGGRETLRDAKTVTKRAGGDHFPVDADPLFRRDKVWGGVQADGAQRQTAQNVVRERGGGPLAVGPGDVEGTERLLRMPGPGKRRHDPGQPGADVFRAGRSGSPDHRSPEPDK